jgi:hypothetical protein
MLALPWGLAPFCPLKAPAVFGSVFQAAGSADIKKVMAGRWTRRLDRASATSETPPRPFWPQPGTSRFWNRRISGELARRAGRFPQLAHSRVGLI